MRAYWIHYSRIESDSAPRFGIIESDEAGRQTMLTPAGRLSSAEDVVYLLVSKGADPHDAADRVTAAMRNGIAHLLLKGPA